MIKGIIGDAVITCECGEEFRVPAYGISRRHARWKYWLVLWKTPYVISIDEDYPLEKHGMHLIRKARLEKKRR